MKDLIEVRISEYLPIMGFFTPLQGQRVSDESNTIITMLWLSGFRESRNPLEDEDGAIHYFFNHSDIIGEIGIICLNPNDTKKLKLSYYLT